MGVCRRAVAATQWLGRPEVHARRAIVDAILYITRSGCAWRQLPVDFPPWQTVYWHFTRWNERGVTDRILTALREELRVELDRDPQPTAGLIDSQSVKGADTVPNDTRGYDAGKKINGRKRFIVTDTLGLLVAVSVVAASVQDRDGAKVVLLDAHLNTTIRHVWADGGFAGKLVAWVATVLTTTLEIVSRPAGQRGFTVLPRRWAVERTLAWLTAHRRLARDYERSPLTSEAFIRWASINQMVRRLARGGPAVRQRKGRLVEMLA